MLCHTMPFYSILVLLMISYHLLSFFIRDRKSLIQQVIINQAQVYVNSKSEMYIPYSLYAATMYSPHGIFEAMPPLELKGLMLQ